MCQCDQFIVHVWLTWLRVNEPKWRKLLKICIGGERGDDPPSGHAMRMFQAVFTHSVGFFVGIMSIGTKMEEVGVESFSVFVFTSPPIQ